MIVVPAVRPGRAPGAQLRDPRADRRRRPRRCGRAPGTAVRGRGRAGGGAAERRPTHCGRCASRCRSRSRRPALPRDDRTAAPPGGRAGPDPVAATVEVIEAPARPAQRCGGHRVLRVTFERFLSAHAGLRLAVLIAGRSMPGRHCESCRGEAFRVEDGSDPGTPAVRPFARSRGPAATIRRS